MLARQDAARAEQLLRGITAKRKGASEDVWMLLGQAEEALNHRDHAIEAYRKVYYGYPLSGRAADAKTGLDRLKVPVGVAGAPFDDELARAERLFAGRRWAEARVALEPLADCRFRGTTASSSRCISPNATSTSVVIAPHATG